MSDDSDLCPTCGQDADTELTCVACGHAYTDDELEDEPMNWWRIAFILALPFAVSRVLGW
jgi:predicted amidophosphoribosyltransferase